ncbi:LamG-like jellyroll fold domain-containing protein [Kitasatospora sp. McL0602]|uniref:LamG-like jellyroll fold domain-containing protein n=1 Tax=Kitasatospora sp. McL0602 TaxID=3439530 RepID=UPI003F8A1705
MAVQPASAFVELHAPLPTPGTADSPQQRSGSAAGRNGRADASATSLHTGKDAGHLPGQGELPELPGPLGAGKPRKSDAPPAAVTGQQTDPPAWLSKHPAGPAKPTAIANGATPNGGGAAQRSAPGATEVQGSRTATSSVFQSPDGTKTMRVYSRPVHYKKPDGSWADIDTSLTQRRDNRWTELANSQTFSFAPKADSTSMLDWSMDADHRLAYSLQGAKPTKAVVKADSLTYPGAAQATDIVYNALTTGVKESLILHDGTAPTSWNFPLDLTGLSASLDSAGNVQFTDAAGQVRTTIPHGFMEDSARNDRSGDGAMSDGVTYRLITSGGTTTLRMDLDAAWLHDPHRVFPIKVDPSTTQKSGTRSTYTSTQYSSNHASSQDLKTGSYNYGADSDSSFIVFDSVSSDLRNMYVEKAELDLTAYQSGACDQREVDVHAITGGWDPSGVTAAWQVPTAGTTISSATFQAPNVDHCPGNPVAVPFDLGQDPTTAGVQLVNNWTHHPETNFGLALTSDTSQVEAWKKFDSVNTGYPPSLNLTYADWAAGYSIPANYNPPTINTTGSQQVTLTNLGANTWNSSNMQVKARFYDADWHEQSVGNAPLIGIPGTVAPGQSVTLTGVIPAMAPGKSYQLCWDGFVNGTASLRDAYNVPVHQCTWVSAGNTPPQLDRVEPLSNSVVGLLSPQLYAAGHDPDNFPGSGLQYQFLLYSNPQTGAPSQLADSGWQSSTSWPAPYGTLAWNSSYSWVARTFDGQASSAWSPPSYFSTQVQQPVITSHLGGAAGDGSGRTFDPQVGNYTTDVTDASVKAVGPALNVTRSYNSLDPRTSTLFGSGWTTAFDMSVVSDADNSGSVVLTAANGRAERFGRNDFQLTQLTGVGDETGDGVDDVVTVDSTTDQLWLYPGPDFSATKRRLVGGSGWTGMSKMTGGDVTGDGVGDLIALQNSDKTLWLYPGYRGGGFGARVQIGSGWDNMTNLAVTPPLGADGRKDLVAINSTTGNLMAYPLTSAGQTSVPSVIGTGWNGMTELVGGDFNHDTQGDIVAIDTSNGQLKLYTSTGSATLGSGTLGAPTQIGTTGGWQYRRDLAAVNNINAADVGTDIVAVDKPTGVQYLYHSASQWQGGAYNSPTGMALYTSAAGQGQTLSPDTAHPGWILLDKSGTRYNFNQPAGNGYVISQITDVAGHAQVMHYNSAGQLDTVTDLASHRALHLGWSGRHVAVVVTDAVTSDPASALTWTYTYSPSNADELDQVLAPPTGGNSTSAPTIYSYSAGSHLRSALLDSAPTSYWRLAGGGGPVALDEVASNQGTANGTYSDHGANADSGPVAPGSTAPSSSFDGVNGKITLPAAALKNSYLAFGLWFRTTSPGVLAEYQNAATSPSHASPMLYVDIDGKLRGEFYGPSLGQNPITTTTSVKDGGWHYALLTGSGTTQTLYLDGKSIGSLSGAIDHLDEDITYVGAGFTKYGAVTWPKIPAPGADTYNHFNGQIGEVAIYNHALGDPAVASLWHAGHDPATELTSLNLPSTKAKLKVTYDAFQDRAQVVTDAVGGQWRVNGTSVNGSAQEYQGQVLGSNPAGYWRLGDTAGTQAANQIYASRPTPNNGTYSNVTLGNGSATFDGSTSWAELPASYAPQAGPGALGLWFNTKNPGVLIGYQTFPIGAAPTSGDWNPALYVGTDHRLRGQFWTGSASKTLASPSTLAVDDGKWHFALLSADTATSQTLYLDGNAVGSLSGAKIVSNAASHVYVGAGTVSDGWPATSTTDPSGHFNGQISRVSAFAHGLTASQVYDLYNQVADDIPGTPYQYCVLDNFPTGYWPFDDTTGNQAREVLTSTAVAQNQGTYRQGSGTQNSSGAAVSVTGPWASGTRTAASFDGSQSYVQLPGTAVPVKGATAASVELWFRTTKPGVLYGYQDFPLGTAHTSSADWNPALYVDTTGHLRGAFYTGTATQAVSAGLVNDGAWHHAVLTASGSSQQLYVDGAASGAAMPGAPKYNGEGYVYLGAGNADGWASAPSDTSGHFNGAIADFAYYPYALTPDRIATHHTAGVTGSPVGSPDAASAYRTAVVHDQPTGYWRLDDPSGAYSAADELGTALPDLTSGTYTAATLGNAGPTNDPNQHSVAFDGSTAVLQLPNSAAPTHGPASMELWFKTTSAGVLYSYQSNSLGTSAQAGTAMMWNPALYVGTDKKLHGLFADLPGGDTSDQMTSSGTVTDGKWHQAVLAATANSQTLYLDGAKAATENKGTLAYDGTTYAYLGAGTDTNWPAAPTDPSGHFNGSIAEASYYNSTLDDTTVAAHFKAMGNGGTAIPMTTATVTDPTGKTLTYRYDTRTALLSSYADAYGNTTNYTYDTSGFLHTVTDPDGHTVTTGHDARGNTVSTTTCQDPAHCNTSYATYLLDPANPLNATNDKRATASDARSSDSSDTTYTTKYAYNSFGALTSVTTPGTSDFPAGRTTPIDHTGGAEQAVDSNGNPTGGTQPGGLVDWTSTPVDARTSTPDAGKTFYAYDAVGNLTRTITPLGLITTYTYDNLGRTLSQTEHCTNCGPGQTPTNTTTSYTWDGQGNAVTRTDPATTDAVTGTTHTRRTTTGYDSDGNTLTQTVADTTGGDQPRTTSWIYNTGNNLLARTTDAAGRSTSYDHDAYGNTAATTDAAGTTYGYSYSATGHLLETVITNFTGSPTNPIPARTQVIDSRAYDPAGRLATDTDAMGRTTHTYYNDDNTVAETDLDGFHNPDGTTRNVVLQQNTYDRAGQLTQRVTGGGKTTVTNTYDAARRATSTTVDPAGLNRTSRNTQFDAAGNILTATLTNGTDTRETDTTYDAVGHPLSQTVKNPPQDSVSTTAYDQRGLPISTVSPDGNVSGAIAANYTTTFTHDATGRLTVVTSPPVSTTAFDTTAGQPVTLAQSRAISRTGYGIHDAATSTQDPDGNVTTFTHTYDPNSGHHESVVGSTYTAPGSTTALSPVTQLDYDALDRPVTAHDAKGQITTKRYDQSGNVVETDMPALGGVTPKVLATFDLNGEQQSVTDPVGAQSLATYDDLGRVITRSDLVRRAGQTTAVYTTSSGYDDAGNRTSVTSPGGSTTTAVYDAAGERTSSTDPLGISIQTAYNLVGQPTKVTLPAAAPGTTGPSTTIAYDNAGQAISTAQLSAAGAVLASTSAHFDAAGLQDSATDADHNTTTVSYDVLGRPVQQSQPVSGGQSITTNFAYDSAGHRTAYTDGNRNTTYYTFNTLGLPESTIEPATSAYPNLVDRTYTTGYDILARPVQVTEPGGVTLASTYDAAGRLTGQSGAGGEAATPTRTLGYDLDGRLTSLSAPSGTQSYTYEDRGAVASSTGPQGNATYTYTSDGQLASRTNTAGTSTFTYDPAGQLKTLADPLTGNTLSYTYTALGQVSTIHYGTGDTRTYGYDDQGNLLNDSLTTSSNTTVAALSYTYLPSGKLKTKTTAGLAGAATHTYTYDSAGRLSTWNNGAVTTNYGYDNNGNLTANGITTTAYNQRNQPTTQGSTNYSYTARGTRSVTVTGSTTTPSTYDAFDELTSQSGATYSYDALGRLAQSAGHTFSYDATTSNLVTDGTETYTRTPDGALTAIGNGTTAALAYNDRHGDLIGTFTANATTPTGSNAYDPWGKPTATTGTPPNLGYQGGWTDTTTGQTSTASRWYDPTTPGFTSRDTANLAPTTSAIANRYTYGAGDPLNSVDPSGHSPSCDEDPSPTGPDTRPRHNRWADLNDDESDLNAVWNSQSYMESSTSREGFYWQNLGDKLEKIYRDGQTLKSTVEGGSSGLNFFGLFWGEDIPVEDEAPGMPMPVSIPGQGRFGLAAGYNSCDDTLHHPRPHPRPRPAKNTPPKIDPHKLPPAPCSPCSTAAAAGSLNGKEDGATQSGIAGATQAPQGANLQIGQAANTQGLPVGSGAAGSGGGKLPPAGPSSGSCEPDPDNGDNCDGRPDFNSDQSAGAHYAKHVKGVDFRIKKGVPREPRAVDPDMPEFNGPGGRKAYRETARDFMASDGPYGSISVQTTTGGMHRFDPATGYYGYLNSGGTISTFFRPEDGLLYFYRSVMSYR